MNLTRRIKVILGVVLASGVLLTGAAFAGAKAVDPAVRAEKLAQAVTAGKLTQSQADVLAQIGGIRDSYREKMEADVKALLEKAVAGGTITQEQADQLSQRGFHAGMGGPGGRHGGKGGKMGRGGFMGKGFGAQSLEELKALLDAKVQAGTLTQEKADQMLQHFEEHAARIKANTENK